MLGHLGQRIDLKRIVYSLVLKFRLDLSAQSVRKDYAIRPARSKYRF